MEMEPAFDFNTPNIFRDIVQDNVIFCIDTSGSMHNALSVVKLHLQETLYRMAAEKKKKFFNVIEFNSNVTAWSDKLICSTRETAALAMEWIKQLTPQTGTNTLDALRMAFRYPQVDGVYLVTDSLPEQHPIDVLDEVVSLSNGRPLHCICITDSVPESALTDFLEDLSVETFGSLHIVKISTHGYVEKISPIYVADHGQGKMLLTSSGGRYTPQKSCSLTSTLQVDPDYWRSYSSVGFPYFQPFFNSQLISPYYPVFWTNRYPYSPRAWSRFYPARTWLKDRQKEIEVGLTLGASAILIGKKVLARRHEDGFFYLGTVQSQILSNQFLVAFGPCKHGDFVDTTYQETDTFDIIDYNEAARHPILTGDHVLSPWEPEGEKFRPGKVLHGQESRHSESKSENSKLTVSFDNGIVANINSDKMVWIPKEFYTRVKLELQMPASARQYIQSQEGYPRVSKPGYPSSGPRPYPKDYPCVNPFSLRQPSFTLMNGQLLPCPIGFLPVANVYPPRQLAVTDTGLKIGKEDIAMTSDEIQSQVIPGTNLSLKELNQKVDSQIEEHKNSMKALENKRKMMVKIKELTSKERHAESKEKDQSSFNNDQSQENNSKEDKNLDSEHKTEEVIKSNEYNRWSDFNDSEKAELTSLDFESSQDLGFYEDFGIDEAIISNPRTKNIGTNTDNRPKTALQNRPAWKYWHSDPIPPLSKSCSKIGPFRETVLQVPLELRDKSLCTEPVEWSSSSFNYVDRFAQYRHKDSVKDLLKTPRPPDTPAPCQEKVVEFGEGRLPQHITDEKKALCREEFRKQAMLSRQLAWKQKAEKTENERQKREEKRQDKILERIIAANQSFEKEQKQIQASCDAKKQINAEIRQMIGSKQMKEFRREENRLKAKRNQVEIRNKENFEKFLKKQEDEILRKQVQFEKSQRHWAKVHNQIAREEAEANARMQRAQFAKLKQIEHFQRIEKDNQERKQNQENNAEKQLALYRSRVFP